ncbi:alpha-N-arabinofuranosidase [Stackebrandtia nassauensis]|uniref:non-reducing end alpha-L-arabinofuranosidase n=1 Tax=Stackebrandtia nassauensis (strain DSM 44728 / CIP 108903 / NRRL B-16338 / NBRC 102104 / LLR-40K-21) TaxID=446470 RepID=D3Q1S3_STANL|nr:alpha-N-arabinofuranosidase [Stackebrandtia nassauensis]ADD39921.1 alpha-L-arabinofuranosidase domain protein [Stackebrandtia nassauensis DSM 44728]
MDNRHKASVVLDPAFAVAPVDRRLFGSFVEHMGRCVYGGIYDPGHPSADEHGLRTDVIDLVRELGVSVVRYPGGNFVSSYRWEDGIGPVADRPRRLNLAWRCLETNEFGLGEFMTWARLAVVEPMMTVNLGTRGVAEACDMIEYCNHPGGTALSDLRRKHGSADPYDIKLWCLGNEMDGPWQVGQKTAAEYGRIAAETGKAMRIVDPSIELVAAGSSNSQMPTFGDWEATLLEHAYDQVDYLSLHHYFDPANQDRDSFLASGTVMDRFIDDVVSTCDHIGAKRRSRKKIKLSFDEWNVWYQSRFTEPGDREWIESPPLIEDDYDATDAVVVGDLLITLLRHADRVSIANQAQLVNVIAPIRTAPDGPAWRQSIFHPFALTSRLARGTVLRTETAGPRHETPRHGEVPTLSTTATHDAATGQTVLFAVNRAEHPVELAVDARALSGVRLAEHLTIAEDDPTAINTPADPDRVGPRRLPPSVMDNGRCLVRLPALSWNALRLSEEKE